MCSSPHAPTGIGENVAEHAADTAAAPATEHFRECVAQAAGGGTALDEFVELPEQTVRGRTGALSLWAWRNPQPTTE